MTAPKPTVLIVHGAWHSSVHYASLVTHLERAFYPALCPTCPSFNAQPPTTTLYEDAAFIRSHLTTLVEQEEKEVVLMMHSYGGPVGTQAVTKDLSREDRKNAGKDGGVVRLVYMTAFVLKEGDSLGSMFGGGLPPFIPVEDDGSCNMLNPHHRFYHDLPAAEQDHWVSELRPHPAIAQLNPINNVGYKYVPSTYLFCEDDQALPLEVQKVMARSVYGDVFGGKMEEVSCNAGHSPFLSMPEKVVEVIEGLKRN